VAQAYQAAVKATSFKRLLVTRCQDEFQKEHKQEQTTTDSSEEEQRKQQILATQQKRMMLGNIRFIGELFKVDMLNVRKQLSYVRDND
jgi:translation initiation factor 4G